MAATLSPADAGNVRSPLPAPERMLAELVALPSVSSVDPAFDMSNRAVVELLAQWCSTLGFSCQVQEVAAGKFNLLARLGAGEQGLLLAGHTDTVPYDREGWSSDPFCLTRRDDRLYGLGSADMKGFFAIALHAIATLPQRRWRAPLVLLATCDEESSMRGAQALVRDDVHGLHQALIGEPTGLRPVTRHKGIVMQELSLQGRSGHSSDPGLGRSALEAMHACLATLLDFRSDLQARYRQDVFQVPVPTLNLGAIHGGDNPNRICAQCRLQFDLRPLPGMPVTALLQDLQTRLLATCHQHHVDMHLRPLSAATPAFHCRDEAAILHACQELTGHAGAAVAFATEAPYLSALDLDTVILGPGDIAVAHQPDEYLECASLVPMQDLLQSLITRFCLA